jgi:hypothetical protein
MNRSRSPVATLALAISALFGGCSADESTWRAELLAHREEKDATFESSSTSPMAGTQYLKSRVEEQVFLSREGELFNLAYAEPTGAVLQLNRQTDAWSWSALEQDVSCRVEREEAPCGKELGGPVVFVVERFHIRFFPGDDRVTFIVFDPDRPEKTSFEHLLYFAPDKSYAVRAHLVELPDPQAIQVLTSRNLEKTLYRFARIRFRLDGKDQELTAFKFALTGGGSTTLFIPFRDGTTGDESYGAGRFLEIEEPRTERFVLDFNRSFNPLCNYSPAYNCAIPPRENHLDVPIRAGERTYPHPLDRTF